MAFGLPAMTDLSHGVPPPELFDGERVELGIPGQLPSAVPNLALFVQSCKLIEILHDVLEILSEGAHTSNARWEDLMLRILASNRQLEVFYDSFAIDTLDLRVDSSSVSPASTLRQQTLFVR